MLQLKARDIDTRLDDLRFALGSNPPEGMTVEAATGLVRWIPSERAGPGTNTVEFIVMDMDDPEAKSTVTATLVVHEVNSPPALDVLTIVKVTAGSVLIWTNQVVDADWPANVFSFALNEGAPPGATLDPTSGSVRWEMPMVSTTTTNALVLTVTDNGSPPMDSFAKLIAHIYPVPVVTIAQATGGVVLSWNATPGKQYQILHSTLSEGAQWVALGDPVAAEGDSATTTVTLDSGVGARFFRVREMP